MQEFLQHGLTGRGTFLRGTVRLKAFLLLLAPVIPQNARAAAIFESYRETKLVRWQSAITSLGYLCVRLHPRQRL